MRIDDTVRKETVFIAASVAVLSVGMELVFIACGAFTVKVLLGNLLGGAMVIANFFFMGLTLQRALEETDVKSAQTRVRVSQGVRLFALAAILALGAYSKAVNVWAMVIPLLFPRLALTVKGIFFKEKKDEKEADPS